MRYMRSNISAQSWLSVPPAPGLICKTAVSSSSGLLSVLLNSASSICSRAVPCASLVSSSVASPDFQNSNSVAKSSTLLSTCLKSFNQYSFTLISFMMPVALVLSSQKPGESESCLSVSTLYMRFSTSKKPPQNRHSVSHILNLLLCHIKTINSK